METNLTFSQRIGPDPHADGAQTIACNGCPDIWELSNGNFAIIGIDITDAAKVKLSPTIGCGPEEHIVRIPRNLLVNSRADIPNHI